MEFLGQQTINGVVLGSVYALYGLGFGLVLANLKIFHVAHAGVFTWGAIFSWRLIGHFGLPLLVALPVAAILSGLLNVIAYFVVIRHLLVRKNTQLAAFISTMGALMFLNQLAFIALHGDAVRIPRSAYPVHPMRLGPFHMSTLDLTIILVTAALVVFLNWLIHRTQFGREARAVAFNRDLAALLGTNVDRVSAGVFFLSGVLGGIAATLVAMAFNVINSGLGETYLLIAVASMVVGGFGSIIGILLGGLFIGVSSAYATGFIDSSYRDLVVFVLLLGFLVIKPSGLIRTTNDLDRV